MQVLFTTLYGSHLYGTNTPQSDLDIKRIVLPDLDDLLLCKRVENKVSKTNTEKNTKNSADDVDQEDIPLQVFIQDFTLGQTYALEIAFGFDGAHARQEIIANGGTFGPVWIPDDAADLEDESVKKDMMARFAAAFADNGHWEHPFAVMVKELRTKFLTSNIKAMTGYVVNQANIYSFKGERLNAVRRIQLILGHAWEYYKEPSMALGEIFQAPKFKELFREVAEEFPKYFRADTYDIGGNRMKPCFFLLEKCLPHTNTLEHTMTVVSTLEKKYGARADAASENNVDWKATMHAVRIVDEGIELLQSKKITLPRPDPARLLQIKRGELPLDPIKDELVQKMELLKELSSNTDLPNSSDPQFRQDLEAFTLRWVRRFYGL